MVEKNQALEQLENRRLIPVNRRYRAGSYDMGT